MIVKYWLKTKKEFLVSLVLTIISTVFTLIIPIFMGRIVGGLSPNSATLFSEIDLWINFTIIVILAIIAFIITRNAHIKSAVVSSGALYHLRADVHNAIYKQSFSYFDETETGQLVARATSDIEQTQMIFGMGLLMGLSGIFQLSGIIVSSFLLNPQLAMIFIIVIPISLGTSVLLARKLGPIYYETRQSFGELTTTLRENIVGAQVVRMFSNQEKERDKFVRNNERFYDASVRSVKLNSLTMPIAVILIGIMIILIMYVGGNMILAGQLTLEVLVTFQSYVGLTMFPLMMLGMIMFLYVQADAALTRVREVLESTPEVTDSPNAIPIEEMKGDVRFENVSFGYTSESRVLKDISFEVPAGKKLAIIGTTGSGKSTIINLLPRFYEINEGSIKIDGVDIRNYLLKDLRRNIGIVSQETFLFNKSIEENISFGKADATKEEIIEAAKIANLDDFIDSLPEGYDTIVGERGTRLSGGQKQRLSIARALIIKPKILIFDDSTSSVDVETEYKIQKALEKIMKGVTTFIITQRISTIRDADSILVLDQGRIVGFGVHDELIKSNPLYRQIFETLRQKKSKTQSDEGDYIK
ncbi:MAG: ABC transporter ATP-binding protein [Promethearchaeota archaeon]|nr:MAG: ABC transporter ATP-binding protein [Candidatus Lokiarchaeota archaeon]